MRYGLWASAAAVALAAAAPVLFFGGCSSGDDGGGADASFDGVVTQPPLDGSQPLDGGDGATSAPLVRVAHLALDVGPLDVCYRTSPSDAFTGPLLVPAGADADAADVGAPPSDAGDAGDAAATSDAGPAPPGAGALRYATVSAYLPFPAGSVEIAVVSAWDRSCASPRARLRVTLDPGERATVAMMGVPGADAGTDRELGLVLFVDDVTTAPTHARMRFIHAALGSNKPGAAQDAGVDGTLPLAASALEGSVEVPLAARIDPRHAATPSDEAPLVDALGYHEERPLGSVALRLAAAADAGSFTWTSGVGSLGLAVGSLHTGFVVVDEQRAIAVLWCDDLAATPSCQLVR